ncbi:MAG TPA: hypothetical protein ENG35_07585 [Desulfobacteraceae bacterium]|nr:hypothetical protein [Desulfobacteraceae bacterium]
MPCHNLPVKKRILSAALILMFLFFALTGCVHFLPHHGMSSQEMLLKRAMEYWNARSLNDLATAYKMESAALPGGWLRPFDMAAFGAGLKLLKVEVTDAVVEGKKGVVTVKADVQVLSMRGPGIFHGSTTKDQWIMIDGEWYHKTYKPVSLGRQKR